MIFVALTFSPGLPGLYLVCAVSLFVTFWVDKYLLIKFYKLSPVYTKYLSKHVGSLLVYSVVIHCIVGTLMLSFPHILQSKQNFWTDTQT